MAVAPEVRAAGKALWSVAAGPDAPLPRGGVLDDAILKAAAGRFARMTGPATAAWLFRPLTEEMSGLLAAESRERAHQFARFMRAVAARWLVVIAEAGVEVVAMKGFATAARFYPEPALRAMSDVDLLVRPRDVGHLCGLLVSHGFRFITSSGAPAWGLSSESSFHPLVARDRSISFDIHVAADDYPVPRTLSVDEVFACGQKIEVNEASVLIPCDDHLVLLAITNAGRDKFGPDSMRAVTDLVVALARTELRPDWDAIVALAHRGGFIGPVTVATNLLAALGVARDRLPGALLRRFRGAGRVAFDNILSDYMSLFAERPSRIAMQVRDWALISSPRTLVRRNLRRAVGLVRPWPGVPEGFSVLR